MHLRMQFSQEMQTVVLLYKLHPHCMELHRTGTPVSPLNPALYKDGWVGVGTIPPPQEMAEIAVKWYGYGRWTQTPESNPMASALSSTQILGVLFVFIPFPVSVRRNPDRSHLGGGGGGRSVRWLQEAGLYHSREVIVGGARRP